MVSRREIWCSRPCVVSDKIITTGTFITTCEPSYYHNNTIRYVVCIASQFIYPHAYTHTHTFFNAHFLGITAARIRTTPIPMCNSHT